MGLPIVRNGGFLYRERVSSRRTLLFFALLTLLFLVLSVWRFWTAGADALTWLFAFLALFFLFYVLNYRILHIAVTQKSLRLVFGIFTWHAPLNRIEGAYSDHLTFLQRMGGAGIHFMIVRGRYRVFFNFLEYPRVTLLLAHPRGLVREVSFSTRRPRELLSTLAQLDIPVGTGQNEAMQ